MTADKPDLTKATPRPWRLRIENCEDSAYWEIDAECWYALAKVVTIFQEDNCDADRRMSNEGRANAALIVEAVNAWDRHLALIAAVDALLRSPGRWHDYIDMRLVDAVTAAIERCA